MPVDDMKVCEFCYRSEHDCLCDHPVDEMASRDAKQWVETIAETVLPLVAVALLGGVLGALTVLLWR